MQLDIAGATGDELAVWEPFQIDYLNMCEREVAIAASKTRQCGFSWLLAAEAVGRAIIYPQSLTNFVSINKDEAEEKIRYARQIAECMRPKPGQRGPWLHWVRDTRGELEATNGSRIRSHASTPPRGRPRANHRLDECAHYQRARDIYDGAAPSLLRDGSIALTSSPWVKGGLHYQIMEEASQFPRFVRMWIPWWEVRGLCNNVPEAKVLAPSMPTAERVEQYGSERLQLLHQIMVADAFQVECELAYADDSLAWITWEEIIACTGPPDMDYLIADGYEAVMAAIPGLLARQAAGRVFAGYDVARKHDKAVLSLLEMVGDEMTCFALLILEKVPFADQKAILQQLSPIVASGCIDATGMGANLAEDMRRFDYKWHEVTFSNPVKAQLAVDLRQQFQDETLTIPPDRDLHRDIHSIRRMVSAANNVIYDAARDEETGHADRFWALALGVNAVTRQWFRASVQPGQTFSPIAKVKAVDVYGNEHEIVVPPTLTAAQIDALVPTTTIKHGSPEHLAREGVPQQGAMPVPVPAATPGAPPGEFHASVKPHMSPEHLEVMHQAFPALRPRTAAGEQNTPYQKRKAAERAAWEQGEKDAAAERAKTEAEGA